MWVCFKCQQKFYNKNQAHSCGSYTVAEFLSGKSQTAIELFDWFLAVYREVGKFELHPVKTRVALLTKMRFCSINKVGKDFIDVHFVLTEPHYDSSCFHRIDNLANRFFIHHFKMYKMEDITSEVKGFMQLAYLVGDRKHIRRQDNQHE